MAVHLRTSRRRTGIALVTSVAVVALCAAIALTAGFVIGSLLTLTISDLLGDAAAVLALLGVAVTGSVLLAAYLQRSTGARTVLLAGACGIAVSFVLGIARMRGYA